MTIFFMKKTEVFDVTPQEFADVVAKEVAKAVMDMKLQPKPQEKPVKVKDICSFFSVAPQTVNNWMTAKTIPFRRMNNKPYFFMSEVVAYLMENPKTCVEPDIELYEKHLPNYKK